MGNLEFFPLGDDEGAHITLIAEWWQRKPIKTEGLKKTQNLIAYHEMYKIQLKKNKKHSSHKEQGRTQIGCKKTI